MKILTSGRLMRKVVDQLNLDILYHSETLLRKQDRYDNTPVTAKFIDEYSNYIDFSVKPLNNTKYNLIAGDKTLTVNFGDTINIDNNRFFIFKSADFTPESLNITITITRISP